MTMMTPAETFDAIPQAQAVTTFHGQGYGKARHHSRCVFTGLDIYPNEGIRKMAIETRDGKTREGHTSLRIERLFGFHGGHRYDDKTSLNHTAMVFVGSEWHQHRDSLIKDLDTLGQVKIVKDLDTAVTYSWDGTHWRKGYARQSTKQMAATLRRTKRAILYSTRPRD